MANNIINVSAAATGVGLDEISTSQTSGARNSLSGAVIGAQPISTLSDSTSVSTLGGALAAAAAKASASSNIRTDLVASLRAQIATATYQPDPMAVAAKVAKALRSSPS